MPFIRTLIGRLAGGGREPERHQIDEQYWQCIACPYCFSVFGHDKVHFKIAQAKTQMDLDAIDMFDEETRQKIEPYLERDDTRFENFWRKYPGSPGAKWEERRKPFLHNNNDLAPDDGIFVDEFLRDEDGFVYAARDPEGVTTRNRICPCCHNPLPPTYGKFPVKFISVVGITSSGKTVYLSQLLKRFVHYMGKGGCTAFDLGGNGRRFVTEHSVERDKPLPIGTPEAVLSTPLFYSVKKEQGGTTWTLVLYDIAGENCVNPSKMEQFGPFIVNADAYILLLDPDQFTQVKAAADGSRQSNASLPIDVIEAMFNAFVAQNSERPMTPLAVSFSKSDRLQAYFAQGSRVYQDVEDKGGFDSNSYNNVKGEVWRFLNSMEEGQDLIAQVRALFSRFGYFAFTALNCEVEEKEEEGRKISMPETIPDPKRIEEPILWILNQLGFIEAV